MADQQNDRQSDSTFNDMLLSLAQGRFHEEATATLTKLVREMNRVADVSGGKPKGKLVLEIGFVLDRGILELDPKLKVTTPATVRARTILYTTPDGRLSRNDTRQGMLPLGEAKDVSTGAPVRDIRERQHNS